MRATWTRREVAIGLGAVGMAGVTLRAVGLQAAEDDLAGAFARIEDGLGARLGVAVLGTGRVVGHRADERFPLCSTFKVLASAAALARVDAGRESLDRRILFSAADLVPYSPITKDRVGGDGMTLAEICRAALTYSDNTAGNLILASLGGPAGVTAFARSIGDPVTRLDRTETTLNEAAPGDPRDTTTPAAFAADLRALVLGTALSPRSREQLAEWMVANTTGAAKLRAEVPRDWRVGDKTAAGDRGTVNDVAVLWPPNRAPIVVAVYITDTKASFDASNAAIAAVGRAVSLSAFSRLRDEAPERRDGG